MITWSEVRSILMLGKIKCLEVVSNDEKGEKTSGFFSGQLLLAFGHNALMKRFRIMCLVALF